MFDTIAPVLLFAYKRLDVLKQTVTALQNNLLARETELFIFSDGGKSDADNEKVALVRNYIKSIGGFKKVVVIESATNKGLANSIIGGVTSIIANYESVIVLEDDLVTSTNFLAFMNQCLKQYHDNESIFSISGYCPPIRQVRDYRYEAFLFPRNSSHGWATWKNRWLQVDWNVPDYEAFVSDSKRKAAFNKGGSDLSDMLTKQMEGRMNSWSIRFCYHQYKSETYTIYPTVSKIQNIGFGKEATHTNNYNRFTTRLDVSGKTDFLLPGEMDINESYVKHFQQFYSIRARAIGRLKTYLNRAGLLKNV